MTARRYDEDNRIQMWFQEVVRLEQNFLVEVDRQQRMPEEERYHQMDLSLMRCISHMPDIYMCVCLCGLRTLGKSAAIKNRSKRTPE